MKIKVLICLIVTLLIGVIAGTAYGEQKARNYYQGHISPTVVVNGKELVFNKSEVPPIIMNDRTLLPLRAVAESLGLKVGFNFDDMRVTVDGSCAVPTN